MTGGLLDRLDSHLQEVGRRQHRFAWLTDGEAADGWLPVDAYYPGHRLVVLLHPDPAVRARAEQLAQEHGLAALVRDPAEIDGELPDPPRPPARRPPASRPPALKPVAHPDRSVRPADGIAIGIALIAAAVLELYLGVVVLTVEDGHWLLGLILVLDACARVVGTLAATRTHDRETVWGCLLIGSPAVIALRLRR